MHLLAERLGFVGDDRGLLKAGVKTYRMTPNFANFFLFFTFIVNKVNYAIKYST